MPTIKQNFLTDIREHPDDTTPRLIFADWLEEHGNDVERARAQFIRVQCELTRLAMDDPRRPRLEAQERALWQQYERRWLQADLPRCKANDRFLTSLKAAYGRGFLERISGPLWTVRDHIATLLRTPVPPQTLQIQENGIDEQAGEVTGRFLLQTLEGDLIPHVRHLDLSNNVSREMTMMTAEVTHHLVTSSRVRLSSLGLYDRGHSSRRFVEQVAHTRKPQLIERLSLEMTGNQPRTLEHICNPDLFPHLAHLRLYDLDLRQSQPNALADPQCAHRIKSLVFSNMEYLQFALYTARAAFPQLASLHFFRIRERARFSNLLRTFAQEASFEQLRELSIADTYLSTEDLETVLQAPWAKGLTGLKLSHNNQLRHGATALLTERLGETNIDALDLRRCRLKDEDVLALACSPHVANIRRLWLADNGISLQGLHALLSSPHLKQLHTLEYSMNRGKQYCLEFFIDQAKTLCPSLQKAIVDTRISVEQRDRAHNGGLVVAKSDEPLNKDDLENFYWQPSSSTSLPICLSLDDIPDEPF